VGDPTLQSHRGVFERIAETLDDTDVVRDVEKVTLISGMRFGRSVLEGSIRTCSV